METLDRQIAGYTLQKDAAVKIVSAVNVILSKAPEVQNKLGQMERQILGLQKSLDEISGKLGTARLGEQLERDRQAERFEVIEQPITPQEPVWPDRRKLVAAGAGLAGVAGAAAVVILELLNQSVRASADIVRSFGRHPIAVIPFIGTRKEGKRKIIKLAIFGIGIIAIVSLLLAAINFYFMPLDLLAIKVLSRLGL
jgi:hypothetical protein